MEVTLFRTDKELKEIYDRNFDSIYRISYMYMRNKYDAEDITQTVFTKLMMKKKVFQNFEHEKRWLILLAVNTCKNHYKTWWNKKVIYEEIEQIDKSKNEEVLEIVLKLPNNYKTVIYLYYYEGYSTKEISEILNKKDSTVRSDLKRARSLLKEVIIGGKL